MELNRLLPEPPGPRRRDRRRCRHRDRVALASQPVRRSPGVESGRPYPPSAPERRRLGSHDPSEHAALPPGVTIVPEHLIGYGRASKRPEGNWCWRSTGRIIWLIQSSTPVCSSVLASLRSLRTTVVAFDTSVVDLSALTADPVDVLFGVQLGGGTDIDNAIAYCEQLVTRPSDTVLVLLSDLFEGGVRDALVTRMERLVRRGVTCMVLLALSDEGAPAYDHEHAAALTDVGVVSVACTPAAFPDLLAAASKAATSLASQSISGCDISFVQKPATTAGFCTNTSIPRASMLVGRARRWLRRRVRDRRPVGGAGPRCGARAIRARPRSPRPRDTAR